MHETFPLIPVRSGSKGLPRKNVRPLAGKPLYLHAVDQALRVFGRCVVSTDEVEILEARLPAECILVERPAELATDSAPMAPVVSHALRSCGYNAGAVVLLQPTSPLRSDEDVRNTLDALRNGDATLALSVTATDRRVLKWGLVDRKLFHPLGPRELLFYNRQELPAVFKPNGAVYAFFAEMFLQLGTFPGERIGAIEMPPERSLDIDDLADFEAVATILEGSNLDV